MKNILYENKINTVNFVSAENVGTYKQIKLVKN